MLKVFTLGGSLVVYPDVACSSILYFDMHPFAKFVQATLPLPCLLGGVDCTHRYLLLAGPFNRLRCCIP